MTPNIGDEVVVLRCDDRFWARYTLLGETKLSWIAASGDTKWLKDKYASDPKHYARYTHKLPKKNFREGLARFGTREDECRAAWAAKNVHRISSLVQIASPKILEQIAILINFKEDAQCKD